MSYTESHDQVKWVLLLESAKFMCSFSLYWDIFFLKLFFIFLRLRLLFNYWKGRESKRNGRRKRILELAGSHPECSQRFGLGRVKFGMQELHPLSPTQLAKTQLLNHHPLPPKGISRRLDQMWNSGEWKPLIL